MRPEQMRPEDVGWTGSPSVRKLDYLREYALGKTALDLGCGRGWYAGALADADFTVTGMDQENQVADRRIKVIEQEITPPLPFAEGAFDTVVMFDILEHLSDQDAILQEVARVCQRRVILSVPHGDAGPLPIYGITYLHYTDKTHLREYSPDCLEVMMQEHGFRKVVIALEGHKTIPLAFSEFVRGGPAIRKAMRAVITMAQRFGLVENKSLAPDIFYVGEKME